MIHEDLSKELKVNSKYSNWLTKDQEQAIEKMVKWSGTNNTHKYVLEGPAGTGKTTIVKEFKKHSIKQGGFIVSAPTHKAVRVVSNDVGVEGHTIQKLLGLRPNMNLEHFDPNNVQYDPFGKRHIENYNTIVIDEASMLSRKMIGYIDKEAALHNVKILYIGDGSQLPPVGEGYSSVFNVPAEIKSSLTTIMRQGNDNPLAQLLVDIRYGIGRKSFDYINTLMGKHNIKEGKGYMHLDDAKFQQYSMRAFNNDKFFNNISFCKLITYTNDNVSIWNKFIRNSLFPTSNEQAVIVHDLFMCYNTIIDEFNNAKITNSEEYIVNDLNDYCNADNLKGWMVKFKEVSTGHNTPYLFIIDHNDAKTLLHYTLSLQRLIVEASNRANSPSIRSKKWKAFYEYKNRNLSLIQIKDSNTGKLIADKDLDYGYAITSHKSQGSTYDHSFVNLTNIVYGNGNTHMVNDANMINRLFYVAASRAKDTLSILF